MQKKIDELWVAYESCLTGIIKLQETLDSGERMQKHLLQKYNHLQAHEVG